MHRGNHIGGQLLVKGGAVFDPNLNCYIVTRVVCDRLWCVISVVHSHREFVYVPFSSLLFQSYFLPILVDSVQN